MGFILTGKKWQIGQRFFCAHDYLQLCTVYIVGQVMGTAYTLMRTYHSLQFEAEGGPAGAAVHTQAVRPASCCTWRQRWRGGCEYTEETEINTLSLWGSLDTRCLLGRVTSCNSLFSSRALRQCVLNLFFILIYFFIMWVWWGLLRHFRTVTVS